MQQDLDYFEKRLLELKERHSQRVRKIDRDIRHEGMSADWTEQATERENDQVLESLGNASELELAQIDTALKRIEKGEYFNCRQCGAEIPHQRLELLPYSSLCVRCAEQSEAES